jgi:endonuclease/exonuclease/phosphatase family metal-dependent hydrolase
VAARPEFSICTYNVNFGSFVDFPGGDVAHFMCPEAENVLAAIRHSGAEIVCLQETNEGWQAACHRYLRDIYPHQHFFAPNRGYYASGIAVLHTHVFIAKHIQPIQPTTPGSFFDGLMIHGHFQWECDTKTRVLVGDPHYDPRAASSESDQKAQADLQQKGKQKQEQISRTGESKTSLLTTSVRIINVHLRPPLAMGDDGSGVLANASAYWRSGDVHRGEVVQFIKASETESKEAGFEGALFVVGDFNEGTWGGAHRYLSEVRDMKSAVIQGKVADQNTWYWPLKWGLYLYGSYDHIFYNSLRFDLKRVEIARAYRDASDHVPVIARFIPSPADVVFWRDSRVFI